MLRMNTANTDPNTLNLSSLSSRKYRSSSKRTQSQLFFIFNICEKIFKETESTFMTIQSQKTKVKAYQNTIGNRQIDMSQ